DQGLFGVAVQLPPAASLERTSAMLRKVEEILAKVEAVDSYQTIGGYGAVTSTYQPNFGSIFVRLKPWEERHEEALHVKGIMARVNRELVQIPEAVAFPFNIPTISGFGAFFGVWLSGYDNNVYVQIGLIMLVGLAAKNAILIVEFAKAKHEEGQSVEAAALESARLRFRPILMTAFAFILGVVPLMLA